MVRKIFLSHTKQDKVFLDRLDSVFGRDIPSFRSELETISKPAWRTLRDEMRKSAAMFLIIGNRFRASQTARNREWHHTQNWIAYEIGLACQLGLDVWVVCDQKPFLNFPVPYLNNYIYVYLPSDLTNKKTSVKHGVCKITSFEYLRSIARCYAEGKNFPVTDNSVVCEICGANYNLHNVFRKAQIFTCPQCLTHITTEGKKKVFIPMPDPQPSPSVLDTFRPQRLRPLRSPGVFDRRPRT